MPEDKLTPAERIRLESIAQANATYQSFSGRGASVEAILSAARKYEEFIKGERSA